MDNRAKPARGLALGLSRNSSASVIHPTTCCLLFCTRSNSKLNSNVQCSTPQRRMLDLALIAGETPFPGENDLPRPVPSKNAALFKFQLLGYMPGDADSSFSEVGSAAAGADA